MKDIITLLDNNRKSTIYIGGKIHVIYCYLQIIVSLTTFTTSGHRFHRFGTSFPINNDSANLHPHIADIRMRHKIICKFYVRIVHKSDVWIIRGPNLLPPSLRIKMNQFNTLHGQEPNEPPWVWNSQPPAAHFKSRISPPKTIPVVPDILGRLNNCDIGHGYVQDQPSEFPFESNYEYVPDTDTTLIKSIDDDEIDHLLEFFHSENDDDC